MDRAALLEILHAAHDAAHRVPLDRVMLAAIDCAINAAERALTALAPDERVRALVAEAAEVVRGSVPEGWFEDDAFARDLWAIDAITCDVEDASA